MTGGSAAHAGIGFQDRVAGLLAVHVVADAPVDFFGLPSDITPTSIELETSAPVDDILVATSADGFCFINVKKGVTASQKPDSPLGSVLDQFVRLWIAGQSGRSSRSWQRPLEAGRDRLVLVTGGDRSASFASAFSGILGRIADRGSITPREDIATNQSEINAYDAVLKLLREAMRRHTGQDESDETLTSLLSMTRVVVLDPDGRDKPNALALLKTAVLADPADAERAWTVLVSECQRLAEERSGADRGALRSVLRSQRIRLRGVPEIAGDVRRLTEFTVETLSSLSHLAHLDVPVETGVEKIEIHRAVSDALVEQARETSMLIIGEPGAGKSGAVFSAATRLIEEGHPVVTIAVDRHPVSSVDDLRRNLGLDRPLAEVLRNWTGEKQGVLFIDALDASRGGPSDRVFQELIRLVLEHAPNWHVVASIRVFDLKFGVTYRDLFKGRPVDDQYQNSEFVQVRHLSVPKLTDGELEQVWSKSHLMEDAYKQGTGTLRDLLRSPFNLFLLANILASGAREVRDVTTQLQLLHLYWSYRVIGSDRRGLLRESLLRSALNKMLDERTLQASVHEVSATTDDLDRLLSEGVLTPAEGTRDRLVRISFAHHVLFDYGVARLTLESGQARDFVSLLTGSDDRALLVAPGAMMAFQMLWQDDGQERRGFWKKAFEVAGAGGGGAFCRMLPARVAATLTASLDDFSPVLECLRRPDCQDRSAAVFLVQHCTGALAAGVVPNGTLTSPRGAWPSIARELANAAVQDVGWMLKPLVAQWVENPDVLTAAEAGDINAAARLMLRRAGGERYDSSMVVIGIRGVARTFDAAPTESIQALNELLLPDRLTAHAHEELSWLAREIKYLVASTPSTASVIRAIYKAGYCTPVPSRDEKTSISGSRILSMTSNRRQDFEHAQWELFEAFPRFFEADPVEAIETLIDIMNCHMALEHSSEDEEVIAFAFGDVTAAYQPDHSYAWFRRDDDHKRPPLHAFETGLQALVENQRLELLDKVVKVVVRKNRLASVWASVIRAAAAKPDVLGRRVLPVLFSIPILDGRDTRKPAGDLLAAIHPLLSQRDRVAVETAILGTDEFTQAILLGCIPLADVASREAQDRRRELEAEKPLPANREPLEITTGWGAVDDDWWLRREGVDLASDANAALNKAIKAVESGSQGSAQRQQTGPDLVQRWSEVRTLYDIVRARSDIPEALLMSSWNAIAHAAGSAAESSDSSGELNRFPALAEMILDALNPALRPRPIPDPEGEKAFAKSPSWGSPAPRIEAAGALMALARAEGAPRDDLAAVIERLSRDPSPAVRHQILGRVNMLFVANPPLMWRLCEIGFTQEENEGVLSFFLPAVGGVVGQRPEWFVEKLLELDDRWASGSERDDHRDEFLAHIVQLILRLWLVYDQPLAGERIRQWTNDPLQHAKRIEDAFPALRGAILQGDPDRLEPSDERVRTRTVEIFQAAVLKLTPTIVEAADHWQQLSAPERAQAEKALRIVDGAAREIYFGSGAYGARNRQADEENPVAGTPQLRARLLREMNPTLTALAQVPYPSVTHHLLETLEAFIADDPRTIFRLVTDALISGGRTGGYQLESLGSDLFGRIVRRYLADFRSVIASEEDLRQRLMSALDIFVEAGWPEARRLVYDLPEMLR